MKRIYLDYAASTPVDLRVEAAMNPYFGKIFGNPHSLHQFGQEASRAVFDARQKIAKAIGADYGEIVFTGSATEANNLAIRGVVKGIKNPEIITLTIEHESVLETCRDLEKRGVKVHYIPVGKDGLVDVSKIKKALNKNTVLVSVIYANNEIGTIQPIAEIARIVQDVRNDGNVGDEQAKRSNKRSDRSSIIERVYPLLHTDAVQAFQYLDCNVENLGVDLMTLSAHKIYGPKGIGALYVRNDRVDRNDRNEKISNNLPAGGDRSSIIEPIITGSGQEGGLRSGTDNVPYIVGFGKAVEIAMKMREKESKRIKELRDYFWRNLSRHWRDPAFKNDNKVAGKNKLPKLQLNGSLERRLPNNLNIYFPGQRNQELLIKLDLLGVASSPGAACSTRVSKISYVLEALGFPKERAGGSLRFSLGRQTTKKDLGYAIAVITESLK